MLFTDGSYEPAAGDKPTLAACGGALMLQGRPVAHFSATIPPALLARWLEGRLQPISQIEMIPLLLARRLCRRELKGKKAICFVDNDGVRENLIRGDSASYHNRPILAAISAEELAYPIWAWYARVASHSNLADARSRLDCGPLLALGSRRTEVPPEAWAH